MIGVIYKSCHDLPLSVFIKIMTTGDAKYLIKRGYFTKKYVSNAWDNISQEYIELSGNKTQKVILSMVKDISQLKGKLFIVQAIVDRLSVSYDPDLVRMLISLGFNNRYNPENKESYIQDLKRTITKAKSMLVQISEKEKSLSAIQSGNEKSTASDYENYIAQLSKYQGYFIDPKNTTVAQFIAIVNRHRIETESHVRQNR